MLWFLIFSDTRSNTKNRKGYLSDINHQILSVETGLKSSWEIKSLVMYGREIVMFD